MFHLGRLQNIVRSMCRQNLSSLKHTETLGVTSFRNCSQNSDQTEETKNQATEESISRKRKDTDRTQVIPVETSIRYLKSASYQQTYGESPVWVQYRRNHKGLFPPRKTRKTCIRQGAISTGSPCPICRDEYLVLDHRNIDLLKQFISPYTGEILSYTKTGLCQKKHLELLVAIERAWDLGDLTFEVPFRKYDYSEYYPHLKSSQKHH